MSAGPREPLVGATRMERLCAGLDRSKGVALDSIVGRARGGSQGAGGSRDPLERTVASPASAFDPHRGTGTTRHAYRSTPPKERADDHGVLLLLEPRPTLRAFAEALST